MMPLFKHQEDMVRFALNHNGKAAIFADCGTGKTRAAIEIYSELRKFTPGLKMLVVAPMSLLDAAWREDIQKFSKFTSLNLHGQPIPTAWTDDIWIINYESLIVERNFKALHSMLYKYPVFLVADESSRMKNHTSKTTKCMIVLRDNAKHRVIMSGTPAPNTPMEYYSQMTFVDRGVFHPSFYAFRNSYFHLARGSQTMQMHGQTVTREAMRQMLMRGFKYEISDANRERLMDRIKPYCYWVKKEDCLDLPEQIDEIRSVELGSKQRRAYNEMKRHLITEIEGSDITATVALARLMKMREITAGFAIDELGQAHDIGENAKLKELPNIIEDVGDKQVIVWGQFQHEIEQISKLLNDIAPTVTMYSGTEDRSDSIQRFQNGDAKYLVCHPRSAAHGLTFVNCSYELFYSLDYSYEAYEQARSRIHRAGQVNKCTYLHLLAKDTIDEDILKVVQRKSDVNDIIYKALGVQEALA